MPQSFAIEIFVALFVPDSITAIDSGTELTEMPNGAVVRVLPPVLAAPRATLDSLMTDRADFLAPSLQYAEKSQLAMRFEVPVICDAQNPPKVDKAKKITIERSQARANLYRRSSVREVKAPAFKKRLGFARDYPARREDGKFVLRLDLKGTWPDHPFHVPMRFDLAAELVIGADGTGTPEDLRVDYVAYLFPAYEVLWRKVGEAVWKRVLAVSPRLPVRWQPAALGRPSVSIGGAPPAIPKSFEPILNMTFTRAADIDSLFANSGPWPTLLDWYRSRFDALPSWSSYKPVLKKLADAKASFATIADTLYRMAGETQGNTRVVQLIAFFGIAARELGIDLVPKAERVNLHQAFAYNHSTNLGNRTAADLFADKGFTNRHFASYTADQLKALHNDATWKSAGKVPKTLPVRPAGSPFCQLDFYKFRGRGYIQLTGRTMYQLLYERLSDNFPSSSFPDISRILDSWQDANADPLTFSAEADWNNLFFTIDHHQDVLAEAVAVHSAHSQKYFALATDVTTLLQADGKGSLGFMANQINGRGQVEYAADFIARVAALCTALSADLKPALNA